MRTTLLVLACLLLAANAVLGLVAALAWSSSPGADGTMDQPLVFAATAVACSIAVVVFVALSPSPSRSEPTTERHRPGTARRTRSQSQVPARDQGTTRITQRVRRETAISARRPAVRGGERPTEPDWVTERNRRVRTSSRHHVSSGEHQVKRD